MSQVLIMGTERGGAGGWGGGVLVGQLGWIFDGWM